MFGTIANDVATRTTLACDFPIPELPDDQTLELDNVAVSYTAGAAAGGAVIKFGQAPTSADCQANAFYIENDRIYLCPESCDVVKSDGMAQVDVLFGVAGLRGEIDGRPSGGLMAVGNRP